VAQPSPLGGIASEPGRRVDDYFENQRFLEARHEPDWETRHEPANEMRQESESGAPFEAILKSIKAAVFEAILEAVEAAPAKTRIEGPATEAGREPPTWTRVRGVMRTTSRMLSVSLTGAA
jgi:hypothetical protein